LTTDISAAREAVWNATLDIYQGFLARDRLRIDANLHPGCTLWDAGEPELIRGVEELNALRRRREESGSSSEVMALDASDPVIDIWESIALVRHWLTVRFAGGNRSDESVRVTTVWRLVNDRWLAVHNHEDEQRERRLAGGGNPR